MNAVFADTFYWIAITNAQDLAHERVKAVTRSAKPDLIITTEEVITEYLNYFAGWGSHFRSKVVVNTQNILDNAAVRVIPKRRNPSGLALICTARVSTKDTACRIASRSIQCEAEASRMF